MTLVSLLAFVSPLQTFVSLGSRVKAFVSRLKAWESWQCFALLLSPQTLWKPQKCWALPLSSGPHPLRLDHL